MALIPIVIIAIVVEEEHRRVARSASKVMLAIWPSSTVRPTSSAAACLTPRSRLRTPAICCYFGMPSRSKCIGAKWLREVRPHRDSR